MNNDDFYEPLKFFWSQKRKLCLDRLSFGAHLMTLNVEFATEHDHAKFKNFHKQELFKNV